MNVEQDLAKLRRLNSMVSGPLKFVINEVLEFTPLVVDWVNVQTSGSAVCRYKTTNVRQYEVRYQFGNIGNLVHELTHIAVNESYNLDFINYPNRASAVLPDRELDILGRCKNEDERQTKQMSQSMNAAKSEILMRIKGWVDASTELSQAQKSDISNKLIYGMINPHKESDTVLNQVLVWLFEWGFPVTGQYVNKPVVNALYEELSTVVKDAHLERTRSKMRNLILHNL